MKVDAVRDGILRLYPECRVTTHAEPVQELGEDFIGQFDVVLGCLDSIQARLYVNSHAMYSGVPYVDGATHGMLGKVQVVRKGHPCLECTMNTTHVKNLEARYSCTGREVSYFEPKVPAEITTTSIIAAIEVREALKIVHALWDNVLKGVLYYDGIKGTFHVLSAEISPGCPNHTG